MTGSVLTPGEVEAEVAGLFIAGFATLSAALTWAGILLAKNPDVQDRLAQEGNTSRLLHAEDGEYGEWEYADVVNDLPYGLRVWKEVLRLYPVLPVFGRTSRTEIELSRHRLPSGTTVLVTPYVTHRDPSYWSNPTRFDPVRFDPARENDRHEFAYYPFSAGPKGCLGRHVATIEGLVTLVTLCHNYRLELVSGSDSIGVDSAINLEPDCEPRIRLRPRDD